MKRILRPLLLLALVAGAGYYWYTRRDPGDIVLTGIVTTHEVVVGPQIQGRIQTLLVNEGDTVAKGALLAVLAPDELREERAFYGASLEGAGAQVTQSETALRLEAKQVAEQIAQAEASLAATTAKREASEAEQLRARLEFERSQAMATSGIGTAQQLEQTRSAYDVAKSQVASLAKEIDAARASVKLARASLDEIAIRRTQLAATRSPGPDAKSPPVDLDVLSALVGNDAAVIEEVLTAFRESAALAGAEMTRSIAAGAAAAASDAAHKLKSAARAIGALRLGDLCERIEALATAEKAGELKALLPLFDAEWAAVLRSLDHG